MTVSSVSKLTPGRTIGGAKIEKVGNKNPSLNILIYGESGTGKTTLCGSADEVPQMRKVLFVDLEGGTESLRTNFPNVDTVRVNSWTQMQAVYNELHGGGHGYETVVIDSLTECQKFNMYTIMKDLVDRKTDENKYVDEDIASVREWGKNIEQMRKFVRAMRDLPIHTIFTALEQEKKDDRTGAVKITPSLSGKLAGEVAAFLDVVMYYYVKEVPVEGGESDIKRVLLTRRTVKHTAKDRTGKLPTIIVDPDMKMLYEYMYPENLA